MKVICLSLLIFLVSISFMLFSTAHSKSVQTQFHSDVIVTHWPSPAPDLKTNENETNEPGFMRQQLIKFGQMASRVGNTMGTHAMKITSAIDKLCEIFKTVVPLLAAVCHVGQFKFCAATSEVPGELSEALNPSSLDLNILD